jgi:hypothetical protein
MYMYVCVCVCVCVCGCAHTHTHIQVEMVSFIAQLRREYAQPMQGVFAACPEAHQQWLAANISV